MTIFCVSTSPTLGKGGISTALSGFCGSEALKRCGFYVIESHGAKGRSAFHFRSALVEIRTRVVPGDVVWLHAGRWFSLLRKLTLAVVARRRGARIFLQFHSIELETYLRSRFGRFVVRRICIYFDGVIVLTNTWKRLLVDRVGLPDRSVTVLANPLDSEFLSQVTKKRVGDKSGNVVRLLALTRLVKGKGVMEVIETMPKLPSNFLLTVAGEGPELDSLRKRAVHLGLEKRVSFAGWVDFSGKIDLYSNAWIFCLPSQYDSFGMGYLEAMAAGVPVVALNSSVTADVVPHMKAGFLVESSSPEELRDGILYCLANHSRLSKFARRYARSVGSADRLAVKLIGFLGIAE